MTAFSTLHIKDFKGALMCGIFAYRGALGASQIVYQGLQDLQYRGYDSWGIASLTDKGLQVEKGIGALPSQSPKFSTCHLALGHTRWATHGGVTKVNAHPHVSCDQRFAVVHNGIIENYRAVKSKLNRHRFVSDTDTEVIAHYLEEHAASVGVLAALETLVKEITGNNAFVVMDCQTGKLYAYRQGSPLVLGQKGADLYLSSDLPSLSPKVDKVYPFSDGQLVDLTANLTGFAWLPAPRLKYQKRELTTRYHMESEMYQVASLLEANLRTGLEKYEKLAARLKKSSRIILTGCGSAYHACLYGQYLLTQAGVVAQAVIASEGSSTLPTINSSTVIIVLSQSGETIDTLDYVKAAQKKGAYIIALTNVEHSTLDRLADLSFALAVGPEYAVASTKAFIFMLMFFADLFTAISKNPLTLAKKTYLHTLINLYRAPGKLAARRLAKSIAPYSHLFIVSHADLLPLGYEAALKFKEIGYLHAENIVSGELKHGPLALVDGKALCLVIGYQRSHVQDNTVAEITARGGQVLPLSLPDLGIFTALYGTNLVHLVSYYHALLLGHNPDQPRNLAKSVTVR